MWDPEDYGELPKWLRETISLVAFLVLVFGGFALIVKTIAKLAIEIMK